MGESKKILLSTPSRGRGWPPKIKCQVDYLVLRKCLSFFFQREFLFALLVAHSSGKDLHVTKGSGFARPSRTLLDRAVYLTLLELFGKQDHGPIETWTPLPQCLNVRSYEGGSTSTCTSNGVIEVLTAHVPTWMSTACTVPIFKVGRKQRDREMSKQRPGTLLSLFVVARHRP